MGRIRTTKIQIPAQRGRGRRGAPSAHVVDLGRGTAPVVLVVPQQRSLSGRLALAIARAMWRRRVAWAPTWAGIGVFAAAGVLSAAPAIALALAVPAVLLPAGWALILRRHSRSAVRRKARAHARAVAAMSAGLGWSALAIWFGPVNGLLAVAWLAGTATAQTLWWQRRRKVATTPIDTPQV
ncbi:MULTISPECIES: hypothetical protein [Streptomyces]|uniref:hypothetical protein n=1 Tax=Streptomyces TaxID=1883 RepID=UPI0004AA38D8|nr:MULTISPECIES: hypothetical protein [Streptomyces]